MPRMAQQGTTSNLRRLAGRRSPGTGGPHIPLESSDYPPVLFRLPEVQVEDETISSSTPSTAVPAVAPSTIEQPVSTAVTTLENTEGGQNVFNSVAGAVTGAVTGAVAGTVANSVAVAGTLAGTALAATPFGSAPGARPSFSSAATSFSSQAASLETPASARSTPVVRPIPESAETDSRSWWEHWSSGIILMLLILALVTAGIMAIRDPDQTRNTQRPIADENKSSATSAKTKPETTAATKTAEAEAPKPTLADNNIPATPTIPAPTASASLSPSLLPEAGSNPTEANKSKAPSFTLEPNTKNGASLAAQGNGSNPALLADSSGFVSSAQPSPGAAASQGSASRLAQEFANSNQPNSTPAISASTQIGKPQGENFEATVPATAPAAGSTTAPNLSWPVEEPEAATPTTDSQSSATGTSGELKLSGSPTVTAPDLLPATPIATPGSAAPTEVAPKEAAPTLAAPATPANQVASRPAYLETSLPNEDLESILEMRRQALASTRVVSNQYYPPTSGAGVPATATQPSANNNGMPTYNGVPSNVAPNYSVPTQPNPQYQNPQYQNPQYQNPQYQNQQYQNQTYSNQQNQPSQYPAAPNAAYQGGNNTAPVNPNAYTNTAVPSQTIGTRSWTYNPNTGTQTTWTLPPAGSVQPASSQAMAGTVQNPPVSNSVPANPATATGGMQMDPNYARQLGYGQTNTSAPNVSATSTGWSNSAIQNRVPVANNPYGIVNPQPAAASNAPNIAAPSGSMMIPNRATNQPNTQPMNYPNIAAPNGYSTGTMR